MTIMMKNKKSRIITAALCILLAVCVGAVSSVQLIAKATDTVYYIEDIRIYADEGKENARNYFNKIGYVSADVDLNADTGTGKDAWLGYKLTTNKDMAITDIRFLGMEAGYQLYDYKSIQEYIMAENAGTGHTLYNLSLEFTEKYKAGSPRALDAYEGLNLFYVDENGVKTKLGDYIIAGKANLQFFIQLLVKAGTGTLNAVLGFLNVGISPFENDYDEEGNVITSPWASLVEKSELWEKIGTGLTTDEENALHQQYNDNARKIFKQLQDFTTLYENAAARFDANDGKFESEFNPDDMEEATEELENMELSDTDSGYIATFELLNTYYAFGDTKLGDWIVSLGRMTSDEIDIKQVYPLVDAMGDNQSSVVAVGGFLAAANNLRENVQDEDFRKMLIETKEKIKEYNKMESMEVYENCDDEIEGKTIGFTNEAIRKNQASLNLGKTTRYEKVKDKINEIIQYINLAMGALFVGVYVLMAVAAAGIFLTKLVIGTCIVMGVLNSMFAGLSAACVAINAAMFWAGPVILGLTVGLMLGFWIGGMLREKIKDKNHSEKPDFIFDAPATAGGTMNVKYKSVLDDDGGVADINRGKQWKWTIVTYSTDERAGSPLCTDKDGVIFRLLKNNPSPVSGYDSAKYFGERGAGDINSLCEDSGAFYLHYRTEKSIASASVSQEEDPGFYDGNEDGEETTEENTDDNTGGKTPGNTKYIDDIILCTGKNQEEAKAKILKHKDAYYVFDYNLSSNQSHATYIGYSITTNPEDAVTDIRIAPYAGQTLSVNYGDVKYDFIDILGIDIGLGDEQTKPATDAMFLTHDPKAGDPIPIDSFKVTTKLTEIGKDSEWIPVSYFGNDQPYNFETCYDIFSTGEGVIKYGSGKDNYLNSMPCSYLYYKPSNPKISGTRYLSGFFFMSGYDNTDQHLFDDVGGDTGQLQERLLQNAKTQDAGISLSHSIGNKRWGNDTFHSGIYNDINLRLLYTWTYYPKRALTNVAVYQGDSFSTGLQYSMSKPLDGIQQNFVAAVNFTQQYTDPAGEMARFIPPGNMFMHGDGNVWAPTNDSWDLRGKFNNTRTDTLPAGIKFGFSKLHFLPTALYVCGPTQNRNPLKLDDVIVIQGQLSLSSYKPENGVYHYNLDKVLYDSAYDYSATKETWDGHACTLEPDTTLTADGRKKATGEFRPVVDIKDPNALTPFNLSFPKALNGDNKLIRDTQPCYIYLRGQVKERAKYISSVSVGSFSRAQLKQANPKMEDKDIKKSDNLIEGFAMFTAASACSDETIVYNFALENQNDAWYNWQKDGVGKRDAPENKPAAYLGVSRTNDPGKAIRGLVLVEINDTVAPNEKKIGKVDYYCAGVRSPIYMDGKTYFLYYTYNKGVAPGLPIEEITIDKVPMVAGHATNLYYNDTLEKPVGNSGQSNFIHLKYTKTGEFFNKLVIGTGGTKNAAMANLLEQGCVDVINLDVNYGVKGQSILIGYRTAAVDWDKVNAKSTEEQRKAEFSTQTEEAIYDVIITRGEPRHDEGIIRNNVYYHLAGPQDLNGGEGEELYLYYASPYYSADYNKKNNAHTDLPQDVFTGYISHFALSQGDRVPYNSSVAATNDAEQTALKWEYIIDGNSSPVDLNSGAVSYSPHHATDIRIYMFAQRSDGSVKPAGEITGGFVSSKYDVGDIKSAS